MPAPDHSPQIPIPDAQRCIQLSPALLTRLKKITPATLKVYIYLCSQNHGARFSASIQKIAAATGFRDRAVKDALKQLDEERLIERTAGRGSQPNQYFTPLPAQKPTAPTPAAEPVNPIPASKSAGDESLPPTPQQPKPTIQELIADRYRPVNNRELAEIQKLYREEAVLRQRLESLVRRDEGVAADGPLALFLAVLNPFGTGQRQ